MAATTATTEFDYTTYPVNTAANTIDWKWIEAPFQFLQPEEKTPLQKLIDNCVAEIGEYHAP